jgi:antitoxin component HigA of HigAB toxin-antitoxin module
VKGQKRASGRPPCWRISEVLNGKRELTKEHIRRLSERFKVSPALFF